MKLKIYQIDAFTGKVFGGNPAAVIPLNEWLPDETMQFIAQENNLSETAFFVRENSIYTIRWFTPASELDLCGHATLASAFVLFNLMNIGDYDITFNSRSGLLKVRKDKELIRMNFPSRNPQPAVGSEILFKAFPFTPKEVLFDKTLVVVFNSEEEIKNMKPDINSFLRLETHGVIITAQGEKSDFVSRFFAPDVGINEDPVTGYAHTLLTPYWAHRLNKNQLHAFQLSQRGGELFCEVDGNRVYISGRAVLYMEGKIII